KAAREVFKRAVPLDFGAEGAPVLADVWGDPIDEGNVEALVVTADGKLAVRHSCEDSSPTAPPGRERRGERQAWRARRGGGPPAPRGGERRETYEAWRARLQGASAPLPGGPGKSGPPPFPPGPGGPIVTFVARITRAAGNEVTLVKLKTAKAKGPKAGEVT